MSLKSQQPPADPREDAQAAPRRKYTAPRLTRLGSVRELTLGSPAGKFSDGLFKSDNKGGGKGM